MKRNLLVIFFVVSISIIVNAQTAGSLSVTTTTSNAGGNYAPRNIVAIWIEDEQGNWVKTLMAYAAARITHLNTWEASTSAAGSTYNTVDAITGATRNSHAVRTCSWNGTDVNGNLVPDGTYRLRMELTDKNGTGNYSSFNFTKGVDPFNITPANVPSFNSISIIWEPNTISVKDVTRKNNNIFPNPSTGKLTINVEKIHEAKIWDSGGDLILQTKSSDIDLSGYPNGIYLIRIITESGAITRKIILQK